MSATVTSEAPAAAGVRIQRLLTFREAAVASRLSYGWFCQVVKAGRGPDTTELGGKVLVTEGALADWIERNTRSAAA